MVCRKSYDNRQGALTLLNAPLLVTARDLDTIDVESQALLLHVLQGNHPVLLLASMHAEDACTLRAALARLEHVALVSLPPLSHQDTQQLMQVAGSWYLFVQRATVYCSDAAARWMAPGERRRCPSHVAGNGRRPHVHRAAHAQRGDAAPGHRRPGLLSTHQVAHYYYSIPLLIRLMQCGQR